MVAVMSNLDRLRLDRGYHYLATPYSRYPAGLEAAFVVATQICAGLLSRGIFAFSPVAHSHPAAVHGGLDPRSHDLWMPLELEFARCAAGLLVAQLPTWRDSKGIQMEIAYAHDRDIPVNYLDAQDLAELVPHLVFPEREHA